MVDDPLSFLARVSDVFTDACDLSQSLERLAHLLVPALADACILYRLDDDGSLRPAARHASTGTANVCGDEAATRPAQEGAAVPEADPFWDVIGRALTTGSTVVQAVRTGRNAHACGAEAATRRRPAQPAPRAIMAVPLLACGRPYGVLGLAVGATSVFTPAYQQLAEEVARRAAHAIDRARLQEAVAASKQAAERARARAAFLADASAALTSSLDIRTTLQTIVKLAVPLLADACSVALVEGDGTVRRVAIAHADPAQQRFIDAASDIIPQHISGEHPVSLVLATGEPFVDNAVTATSEARYAEGAYRDFLRGLNARAKMVVALEARGRRIGAIMLATTGPARTFDSDDVTLWTDLGRRAALALDNARLYQEACVARERLEAQYGVSEAIVQNVTEGIMVGDRDGRLTYVNPGAERILGWTPEQLLGRTIHDVVHVRDAAGTRVPWAECPVSAIYTTGARVDLDDEYYIRADGVIIPVAITASPLLRDGRVVGAVTVFRDVSAPRRQREALRRSEERLRRALAAAGMITWERDLATGYTHRSDLASALFGHPNDELVEDPLDYLRLVHPDDRDDIKAKVDAAVERGEGYDVEFRVVWADGTVRWLCGRASVVHDEHGIPRAMSGTTHDVTERIEAQQALRRLLDERQAETEELRQVHQRLQRSLAALLGLHDVGKLLTSVTDQNAAGRRLLEIAVRAANLQAATLRHRNMRGRLRLWQRVGSTPELRAAWKASSVADARARALASGQPVIMQIPTATDADVPAITSWCIPLRIRGEVIGVLEALGEPRPADEPTLDILGSIALQAATALENFRLYRDVADSEQALRRLVHQLMTAQEDERRRLANDIHDGFAQLAAGVQQVVEAYAHQFPGTTPSAQKRMDVAIGLARRTVAEIRRVLAGLRPSVLEDFGLERALRAHATGLEAEGLHVTFTGAVGSLRLTDDVEIALFRVTQEALTNVQKHADVSHADVRLLRSGNQLILEVQDLGRGFDVATAGDGRSPGEHLGLLSMSERVAQVAGTLEITSQSGAGTLVRAAVPLMRAVERLASRKAED